MWLRKVLMAGVLATAIPGCGINEVSPAGSEAREPASAAYEAPEPTWPEGEKPDGAAGTEVVAFATGLVHPNNVYVLPNGDVLVAESGAPTRGPGAGGSADRISLLRDTDGDGVADVRSIFIAGLHSPFGMALIGDQFYVADTDAILRFPYHDGQQHISESGTKLIDLPAGAINRHWAKNLLASADGRRLYVAIGANSDVGENGMEVEEDRAAIWEVAPDSGEHHVFASGLRNPVGMAWEPESATLWTVVDERVRAGDEPVADYLTAVHDGDFFGWPYSYSGRHVDARAAPQRPEQVAQARTPDYELTPGAVSLGLAASLGNTLPARFAHGMFVSQHGGDDRVADAGNQVIFVPFKDAKPAGDAIKVLDGFSAADGQVRGRPVGVAVDSQGGLLVADDVGGTIWRVTSAPGPGQEPAR